MEIGIAWWNTSLSPNANPGRATVTDLEDAVRTLEAMAAAGASLIGLCELAAADLAALVDKTSAEVSGFTWSAPGKPVSPWSKFDTCIGYDPAQLEMLRESDVLGSYGDSQLRIGQLFSFSPVAGGSILHVIVSHWPSRQTLGARDPMRVIYGQTLRVTVNALLEADDEAQVVLMGDYNDEPFNDSVSVVLRASRDRDRSRSGTGVLFNPFWRHMASFEHDGHEACSDQGTYYYKSGVVTRWHTFDQMIFSSSLVSGSRGWRLDEDRTRAFSPKWLDALLLDRKRIFDHRPIFGRLTRV